MMRWLGGCAGALFGVAIAAAPVGAAVLPSTGGTATTSLTNPSSSTQVITTNPMVLSGVVSRPGGNVLVVRVTVDWTDTVPGRPKIAHPPQQVFLTPPGNVSSWSWSYPFTLPANGQYTVIAVAGTDDGTSADQEQTTSSSTFYADVPPAAPSGLTEVVSPSKRTVSLSWSPNPEADLIGYDVLRAGPTSASPFEFVNGVSAPGTSFVDTSVASRPAGTYRYELIAARPSATGTHLDFSAPSTESDATFTSAPIPPPTVPNTSTSPSSPNAVQITNGPTGVVNTNPALTPAAGVLPGYDEVVGQANSTTATTEPPDTGYTEQLPYKAPVVATPLPAPPQALGPADKSSGIGLHSTAEFIAGALLLLVLAVFAWMIKRAAEPGAELEHVGPDDHTDTALALDTILSPVAVSPLPVGVSSAARPDPTKNSLLLTISSPVHAGAPEFVDVDEAGWLDEEFEHAAVSEDESEVDEDGWGPVLTGRPRPLTSFWRE